MILTNQQIRTLGIRFAQLVRDYVGDENMNLINLKNDEYTGDFCASHEYCDPNHFMITAFEELFGYTPDFMTDEGTPTDDELAMRSAWTYAKVCSFFMVDDAAVLLRRCLQVLNSIPNKPFWFSGDKGKTNTYALASQVGSYFRERGMK